MTDPSQEPGEEADRAPIAALINNNAVLFLVAGLALVVVFAVINHRGGGKSHTVTTTPSATVVLYEVEGTSKSASITYETPTGSAQATPDVPLHMVTGPRAGQNGLLVSGFHTGDFVYLSAQNQGILGTVVCRITVDGVVVAENTSNGEYSIATCQGTVP